MAQNRSSAPKNSGSHNQSTGDSRRKSPQKRTPSQKSSSTRSSANPTKKSTSSAKKQEVARPQNNQFWSVILFAMGILVLFMAVIEGSHAWQAMHRILLGLFGVSTFLVPLILIYTAILVGQDKNRQASGRAVWGVLLTIFCCGFVQIFFGETKWDSNGFVETVRQLYQEGLNLHGGGLLSGVIAWPLIWLLAENGAKIVIVLLMFVLLMLLTNLGVPELFRLFTKPFVWIWHGIVSLATRNLLEPEEVFFEDEDEPEDDSEIDLIEEQPAAPRFQRRGRTRTREQSNNGLDDGTFVGESTSARTRRRISTEAEIQPDENALTPNPALFDNIDVDIPIFHNGVPIADDQMNPVTSGQPIAYQMTMEEDAALQEMIANADMTQESNVLMADGDADTDADESGYEEEEPVPYIAPPINLLQRCSNSSNDAEKSLELKDKAKQLVDTLASFGVQVRITGIRRGPTVTRYEIQPAAGVKISKITALQDDIGLNLGGESVRIEAPIPGKPAVGVEVPNNTKDIVTLRELLETPDFQEAKSKLTFAVGKDIDGNVILGDIAKMPHMIIAGATGSGKSVCTNSIIMSILFHASPEEVRLVLVDPKVVEFAPYDGIPHLLIPVVTNPQKAAGALNWAVIEMERRYALCAQYGVRDLKGYNAIAERNVGLKKLPQVVIMIDEFADLMMTSSKEVESAVIRIAQKARAAGMHLIIATQRPTVDVITGLIKSNVPSRIGMSVKSNQDSRNILDCSGAETLLGNGDLLFYPNGWREPKRVQGCFCSDSEVEAVASFLKSNGSPSYDMDIMEAVEQNIPASKGDKQGEAEDNPSALSGDDAVLMKAAELAVDMGQLSTTALQRRLKLGYARAARIMEEMEERGIIGPPEGAKPRKVMMTPQELTEWKLRIAANGGNFTN